MTENPYTNAYWSDEDYLAALDSHIEMFGTIEGFWGIDD